MIVTNKFCFYNFVESKIYLLIPASKCNNFHLKQQNYNLCKFKIINCTTIASKNLHFQSIHTFTLQIAKTCTTRRYITHIDNFSFKPVDEMFHIIITMIIFFHNSALVLLHIANIFRLLLKISVQESVYE